MTKAKALAKKKGVTFNDLMLAITSKAVKKYFTHFKDESKEITISLPFSFKTVPHNPKDYRYGNQVAALTYYLTLYDNFD